ncbi:MAG: hypothetical protein COW24_04110 [Candidatus Kerfeldbacteria bacterium CG15_BIG_FIL_POST_REV_8_21_14_020_45_12]|uniref:Uncharacterized protein n=1 Tax=Candidatus Kerfeldbacteria bacterium CG15_BIG_FIL_POST_REV_8_21_14_020_45_12 TaxID=2014247 RepID=A0A2M7H3B1_9BACT|nr:MAG: hypothetical protein COW24_04110 [Candidatus Kerfeldbacteria bacterium CG15_BIG_FIL_POST_REV_8_21_14_020_45_12]PJA93871.1 MAG: hypothetical protein CO132_01255 [Candidatus Kerfeldbacteria bacterium CG_4_9_14_3_um_filter_45_8]
MRVRQATKYIWSLVVGALALSPVAAFAQNILPGCAENGDCTACDFITLFVNIAQWVLGVVSGVAMLMVVVGGLMWIISAGNPERVKRGQQILIGAVIGVALVLSGYLIVSFTIASLLGQSGFSTAPTLYSNDWNEYCTSGTRPASANSDCSDSATPDGALCKDSSCGVDGGCVCASGTCTPICTVAAGSGGKGGQCVADGATDCTGAGGTVISNGGLCGNPSEAKQICCTGL